MFYSHVNYSVTKIDKDERIRIEAFYSHVNYSVTKMSFYEAIKELRFTVT